MDVARLHLILAHVATVTLVLIWLAGLRFGFRPSADLQRLFDELVAVGAAAGLLAWWLGPSTLETVGLQLDEAATWRAEVHEAAAWVAPWLLIPLLLGAIGLRLALWRWRLGRFVAWFLHTAAATVLLYLASLGGAIRHS